MYIPSGEKLVGVNISPDETLIVEGTECEMEDSCEILLLNEVTARFQMDRSNPYKFPVEVVQKEVVKVEEVKEVKNVTANKTKSTPRKSTRK